MSGQPSSAAGAVSSSRVPQIQISSPFASSNGSRRSISAVAGGGGVSGAPLPPSHRASNSQYSGNGSIVIPDMGQPTFPTTDQESSFDYGSLTSPTAGNSSLVGHDLGTPSSPPTRIEVDPYDVLAAALVPGALQRNDFRPEKKRWYVLLVFSWLSALQGLIWCTFSTVPENSNNYFGEPSHSQDLLNLILNWGPIIYLPAVFVASWMLTKEEGLRKSVLLGSTLCFLGASIRCIPTFLKDHTTDRWYVLFCLHFGQILNALVGPLVQASPSYLSVNWFADGERATATAIGTISQGLGIGFAYLLGPAIVQNGDDVAVFMRAIAVMAFIPLMLVLLFFPDHPNRAPSATYADRAKKKHVGDEVSYFRGLWLAFKNRSFLFLVIASSLQAGAWFVWSSTLPSILAPYTPEKFSESQTGSFASVTRFAGMIGGFLAGRLADGSLLHRRLKSMICLFMLFAIVGFTMFTLSNPSILEKDQPPFPQSYGFEFISVAIAGFFLGAVSPLFLELSAELTYPSPESTSAAIMTLCNNFVMLILYTTTPQFDQSNINSLMTIITAFSLLILLTLTEEYKRQDAGVTHKHHNAGVAAVLRYYSQVEEEEEVEPTMME